MHDRVRDTSGFTRAQARLRQMAPAPTTEAATQKASARGPAPVPDGRLDPDRVAPPSSTYTAYTEGGLFTVRVPSNWRELPGGQAVIFAPEGAYGRADGQGTSTRSASRPASASRSTTPRPVVSSVRFSSWIEMHRRCRRVRFRTAPGNRTWDRVHC